MQFFIIAVIRKTVSIVSSENIHIIQFAGNRCCLV